MKKKLLPLAIAAAMAPGFASAADISGFADVTYVIADDSAEPAIGCAAPTNCENTAESKFSTAAEVDVIASPANGATVRLDVDLQSGGGLMVEQAYFGWDIANGVTLLGGVINNPVGQEAEDAPDFNFTTGSAIGAALNNQTTRNGNNVEGLAVSGAVGPATVTAGLLNHISGGAGGASTNSGNGENSIVLVVNATPMPGLDLELGLVTQEANTDTAASTVAMNVGDVIDLNLEWAPAGVAGLRVGLDYATFDSLADTAYNIWAKFAVPGTPWTVGLRLEEFEWATATATNPSGRTGLVGSNTTDEATTFHIAYAAASNLTIALEVKDGELGNTPAAGGPNGPNAVNGIQEGAQTTLELLATF